MKFQSRNQMLRGVQNEQMGGTDVGAGENI